ncbi:MAG: IS110 family transposase [Planctomycetaceae bacterium]|nr:IS110 family transposase [Planctomycetaceae bacterium]
MNAKSNTAQPMLFIGIDWADKEHALHLISSASHEQSTETLPQDPEAISQWATQLGKRFPQHRLMVILEQSRGALFAALAEHSQLELYPLNPKQLSRYRDSLYPSGGKNDPMDARLLAMFLKEHCQQLRQWQPDNLITRQISQYSEIRRKLVDERKRLVSKMQSILKTYFPQALTLFQVSLHDARPLDLLKRWPSLQSLKRVRPETLRSFLKEHRMKNEDKQTEFVKTIRSATPLTKDKALIEANALYVQTLVQQIRDLNQAIEQFEQQLKELVKTHPDAELFQSLPGAGEALVPRLIAVMGSQRERYQNAAEIQCRVGIAPITIQSGKSLQVRKRIAYPKFLRQTFHEFAEQARLWSPWSKAFYQMKKEKGMKHQAIIRALAYKWIRIIYQLWKTKTRYDANQYHQRLKTTGSPIINFLEKS